MSYFDCYLVPVAHAHRTAYEALAGVSSQVIREHGALRVVECWLDEAGPHASSYHGNEARQATLERPGFAAAAGARAGEAVVMSWVEWPDRATRDAGMEKFTRDPRVQFEDPPAVFDGERLIAGGFKPMLESRGVSGSHTP